MLTTYLPGALADADPETLWAIGIWTTGCILALWCLVLWVREADREMQATIDLALATEADDWDEPNDTETGWLDEANEFWWIFPAAEFRDIPIFQQLRHEEDVRFAAAVLADIEDLPGGDAA